jgi:hypothetical protein
VGSAVQYKTVPGSLDKKKAEEDATFCLFKDATLFALFCLYSALLHCFMKIWNDNHSMYTIQFLDFPEQLPH